MSVTINVIKQPAAVSLSRNEVTFQFEATTSGSPTNIKVHLYLKMYLGGSTTAVQSVEVAERVDDDGKVSIDVDHLLESAKNYAFTYPESSLSVTAQDSLMSKFDIFYFCTYTEDGTAHFNQSEGSLSDFYYLNAGISADDNALLADGDSSWWDFHWNNQLFLNFMPQGKRTVLGAPEKLYWIALRTATEAMLIRWTAKDGTTGIITKSKAMAAYTVYECIVSPALVQAYVGKDIASYTVEIDGFLGKHSYILGGDSTRNDQFFLFQNQMGTWESLWAKGQMVESHKYEKTAVEVSNSTNRLKPLAHENNYIRKSLQQGGQVSTGIIHSNDWALWASDMLSGAPVYIITDGRLLPIVISTDSSIVDQRPAYSFISFNIKYTLSKRSQFPNRMWQHLKSVVATELEDGSVLATEDGKIIIYD